MCINIDMYIHTHTFCIFIYCALFNFSHLHRMTGWLRLAGISGDCLVQPQHPEQGHLEQVTQVCVQ